MEIWKDILGYEGRYQVSNLGRVKSLSKGGRKEKILKEFTGGQNNDSIRVCLTDHKGNSKCWYINTLAAQAFVPNPNNLPEAQHKNGDKKDNRADNLVWGTVKTREERNVDLKKGWGKPMRPIHVIKDDFVINTYPSIAETVKAGYNDEIIRNILNGKLPNRKSKGCTFKYA